MRYMFKVFSPTLVIIIAFVMGNVFAYILQVQLTRYIADDIYVMKISQLIYCVMSFVVPTLLANKIYSIKKRSSLLKVKKLSFVLYLTVLFFMIMFLPTVNLILYLNSKISLPAFMAFFESWAIEKERLLNSITEQMLTTNTLLGLTINVFIFAVVAGIGEEMFFRGYIQGQFAQRYNHHIAIWITAFLFSAIHFQFFGFFPRMILGAIFGYMAFWSASITLPIVAHVINNTIAVVVYYFKCNSIVSSEFEKPYYIQIIISLPIAILMLIEIKKECSKNRTVCLDNVNKKIE